MKTRYVLISLIVFAAQLLSANAYLGIMPGPKSNQTESSKNYGIQIYAVKENTPAAKADLERGDIILKFDGQKVYTTDQFNKMLSLKEAGDKVKMVVERAGDQKTIKVVLSDNIKYGKPYLGVFPGNLSDQIKKDHSYEKNYGIYLNKIVKDGPAAKAGINDNTILMKLNKDKIFTVDQLLMMMKNYKVGEEVDLTCFIKGKEQVFKVKLGENPNADFSPGGIDFFDHPNNIFMYKFPGAAADSLDSNSYELFFNGKQLSFPDLDNMMMRLDGMDDLLDQKDFDINFKNLDFKNLDEMKITINGKEIKLPKDLKNLNSEKLEQIIRKQMGDSEEKNIEIKILKSDEDKEQK